MALDDVVLCSGGLYVAQRGADLSHRHPALRVGSVTPLAPPGGPPVEARRADNVVWRRHWLQDDRLVVEFVDVAIVEVRRGSGTVVFDRQLAPDVEQHLLFDHVLPLVLAQQGALVVHGGLISLAERGVVLIGASGAGKSTLTAFASQHGWTVGGDDAVVLLPTDPPKAEPTYATVRLSPTSADLLGLDRRGASFVAGKVRMSANGGRAFRQDPVDVRLIVTLERAGAGENPRFDPLAAVDAHVRLFGATFHAELSRHRLLPAVVAGLASVVEATPVGRLTVPWGLDGLAAAEKLLRARLDTAVT
ncbi:MAG: hypothetical protein M3198_19655 [Actinomycetota bacterium]|nr:hypothetical protein [Actinomycetota bacterium]